jgi:hypothetical protein
MLKMLVQVRRKPGMTDRSFYDRWRLEHGALVKHQSHAMAFLAYIQTHRTVGFASDAFAWTTPSLSDGQAALSWPSTAAMHEALTTPEGMAASAALEIDEQAFTDTTALSAFVISDEVEILNDSAEHSNNGPAVKLMVELRPRSETDAEQFSDLWRNSHGTVLRQSLAALGCSRILQNHPDLSSDFDFAKDRGWLTPPDGIEEFWWADENAMRSALASAQGAQALSALAESYATFASKPQTYIGEEKVIFDYR